MENQTVRTFGSQKIPSTGIKLAIIGPPQSGKSVLLMILGWLLPRWLFASIEGDFIDGESQVAGWFSRASSELRSHLRKKRKWTSEMLAAIVEQIRNCSMPLTFVNLGGMLMDEEGRITSTGCKLTPQNEAMMRECTHYLVIASPAYAETAAVWVKLAEEIGLKPLVLLESVLEGAEDKVFEQDRIFRGRVTGLDRNNVPYESTTGRTLATWLINLGSKIQINDGSALADINFPAIQSQFSNFALEQFTELVAWAVGKFNAAEVVKAWGNTETSAPVHAIGCNLRSRVSYSDPKVLGGYVELPELAPTGLHQQLLTWQLNEYEQFTLVHGDIVGGMFSVLKLAEVIPPAVNVAKGVIVSGKWPRWLMGAVLRAYFRAGAPWVALVQPRESTREVAPGRIWQEQHPGMGTAVVVANRDQNIQLGAVIPFPLPGKE